MTQKRIYAPAKRYLARHQAEGKTKKEALRSLKRQLGLESAVSRSSQGLTRCRLHGGATPQSRRAAERRLAGARAQRGSSRSRRDNSRPSLGHDLGDERVRKVVRRRMIEGGRAE